MWSQLDTVAVLGTTSPEDPLKHHREIKPKLHGCTQKEGTKRGNQMRPPKLRDQKLAGNARRNPPEIPRERQRNRTAGDDARGAWCAVEGERREDVNADGRAGQHLPRRL
jgi:hypothetical protein